MTLSDILTIIGIVVGVFVAFYLSYRDSRKTRIFFFEKQKVKLYNDLIKNIPDLDIKYKGKEIQKTMFLLSGVFICSGNKDIVESDVHKGITITNNDDGGVWEQIKITKKLQGLDLYEVCGGSNIVISFKFLKDKDYFVIEALGQGERLSIDLSHRIANVSEIHYTRVGVQPDLKTAFAPFLFGLLMILILAYTLRPSARNPFYLRQTFYNGETQPISTDPEDFVRKYIIQGTLHQAAKDSSKGDSFEPLKANAYLDSIRELIKMDSLNIVMDKNLRIYETKRDSVSKIAAKDANMLQLLTGGESKLYRLDSQYFISYHYPFEWSNMILLIPFSIILIYFYTSAQLTSRYFRYRKVAGLASKLLAD